MSHAAPGPKDRKLEAQPQDHGMEGHFWCQPRAPTDAFLSQEGVFISLESQLGVGRGQLLSARSPGLSPEVASGWGDSCLFSHLST